MSDDESNRAGSEHPPGSAEDARLDAENYAAQAGKALDQADEQASGVVHVAAGGSFEQDADPEGALITATQAVALAGLANAARLGQVAAALGELGRAPQSAPPTPAQSAQAVRDELAERQARRVRPDGAAWLVPGARHERTNDELAAARRDLELLREGLSRHLGVEGPDVTLLRRVGELVAAAAHGDRPDVIVVSRVEELDSLPPGTTVRSVDPADGVVAHVPPDGGVVSVAYRMTDELGGWYASGYDRPVSAQLLIEVCAQWVVVERGTGEVPR